ncbi:hypothetical protein BaRGS_00017219 [Batillaria attramentaria]|uniref:Uncharacterized protein n=1 Tax=Batillaria attramentaria TaxID=370345 RepID=A0ABD0KX03_9CAEN
MSGKPSVKLIADNIIIQWLPKAVPIQDHNKTPHGKHILQQKQQKPPYLTSTCNDIESNSPFPCHAFSRFQYGLVSTASSASSPKHKELRTRHGLSAPRENSMSSCLSVRSKVCPELESLASSVEVWTMSRRQSLWN